MTYTENLAYRPKAATPSEDDDNEDDDVMVIGIDFGTTYSGVAWATVADFASDQINLITSWPGTGFEEGKAPTELFYEDDAVLLGDEDLPEETRSSEFMLRGRKMLKETGKTAVALVADYLRLLWGHVLETVGKARGEYVIDALRFHVVITVPAIWKGYARQGMEEAARLAGILDSRAAGETLLSFVPEPEAAALSTLCEPGRRTQPGEVYVICDAGGGTVDLISYRISGVNPITMHEAVEGTGGLCGGIFIDEAFEHACKSRLGRRWDRLSKAGIKEIIKGEWEQAIKRQFKPQNSSKEYIVSIPAEAFGKTKLDDLTREPFIKQGRIHFSSSHIQQLFTEPFSRIDTLVDGQISKAKGQGLNVRGIILVGGLGASPYLYDHLKARHSKAGITILQSGGIKPRTAICAGAVYKGFLGGDGDTDGSGAQKKGYGVDAPISVASTISRTSIGIAYSTVFDSSKHLEEDKKWDADEGQWEAEDQMEWYLRRGDNVSTTEPRRHQFYRLYKADFGGSFGVELWQCEDQTAPSRRASNVVRHCRIECTLDVPYASLEDFVSVETGARMKKLTYDIEMVPSGATVQFTVYIDGRKQGGGNANVRF